MRGDILNFNADSKILVFNRIIFGEFGVFVV